MRINVLGCIEITDGTRVVRPAGHAQRALLATLVMNQGTVVPLGRLNAIVWGDREPATARTKIQNHMSALRRAMDSGPRDAEGPLLTIPPGYLLSELTVATDVGEFHRLMTQGTLAAEAGEPENASLLLGQALARWRGPAYAGVSAAPVKAAAEALNERRLLTAEVKADADLALGRYGTVVTELSSWLETHPFRERLRGLLMLALYRLGCRADAIAVYRRGHQMMTAGLGLEPGSWLRGIYENILADITTNSIPDNAPLAAR
jgi:DNA-binding SARP family transcriptional activator